LIKALCLGVVTVDTIALVDKYPAADERVLAQEISRSIGGPAAVAAVTLARLGVKSAFSGTIGDDQDAEFILESLNREGVDTSAVSRIQGATSGSVIVVSKSEKTRAISTRQPILQNAPNNQARNLAKQVEWIHVDHVGINSLEKLGVARGGSAKISFDAGYGVKDFDVNKVDLFAPNDRQMLDRHPNLSTATATEFDAKAGSNIVATTMGSKGLVAYSAETGLVNAGAITGEIVSTLGAGDVFHGALLANLISGFDLKDSLNRANVVAGLSCRGLDGTSAIPNNAELENYLKAVENG
jgi:sulfofructose kinase